MISYIIPTRNRHDVLSRTVQALDHLDAHEHEIIIVDNGSHEPVVNTGGRSQVVRLEHNIGAAARNIAARRARGEWIVMLDDDSHPLDLGHLAAVRRAGSDVGAIMADITLPDGSREQGGLPEVFIGCGTAMRREIFLRLGGYDASFGYYAEEYDLAAKLMLHGWRTAFDPRFKVIHHKVAAARDRSLIFERLVRNNGWVAQRYAPDCERRGELARTMRRYRSIANRESALAGYARGMLELRKTLSVQERTPLDRSQWERFIGLASARAALQAAFDEQPFSAAAMIGRGKNDWVIERALRDLGCSIVEPGRNEDVRVVGTLSPGPMLDQLETAVSPVRLLPSSMIGLFAKRCASGPHPF
jgi:GT2 family glycosyltransferase